MKNVKRLYAWLLPQHMIILQTALLLVCSFVIFTAQASAVVRFNDRSLFVVDPEPGATTQYMLSLTYNNEDVPSTTVGSLDLLFCQDPLPDDPCASPPGLDVSHATLDSQTGVTGYSILSRSTNHIILTRTPGTVGEVPSTYTLGNILNPTNISSSYGIRLSDYSMADPSNAAKSDILNLGSVLTEVNPGVVIDTQVPPILAFCVGQEVEQDCSSTDGVHYTDMGTLSSTHTLTATSQMAASTNASGGYVITANGPTMEAGTHVIDALTRPTVSAPGNSQFGINVVANSSPSIGADPDGDSTNAVAAGNYSTPNEFMYHDGDVVAEAPNVSLERRYTVSYIVNVPPNLRAGVYTTTLTYICSGLF